MKVTPAVSKASASRAALPAVMVGGPSAASARRTVLTPTAARSA